MLNLPFFKQETDYYCGPAVLQMILQFYGQTLSQTELAQIAGTTSTGTSPTRLLEAAQTLGLQTKVIEPATISELKSLIDEGLPVVVNFTEPESNFFGHYAIAVNYDATWLYLQDPDSDVGPQTKYDWIDFDQRWHDHDDGNHPTNHWLAVFSKSKQTPFKQ